MSCSTSTAPARRGDADRRAARDDHETGSRGSVSSGPSAGLAAQRRAELRRDVRLADDLEVVPAVAGVLQPQHPPRRVVRELHAPVLVDDQHAFDHAGEDGLHARAIAAPGPRRADPRAPTRRAPARRCRSRRCRSRAPAATSRRRRSARATVRQSRARAGSAGRRRPGQRQRRQQADSERDERDRRTSASWWPTSVSGSARRTTASAGASGLRTGTAT